MSDQECCPISDVDKNVVSPMITDIDKMLEETEKEAEQMMREMFEPLQISRKRVAKRDTEDTKRSKFESPPGENIKLPSLGKPWPKDYGKI
jgi:hypothetical protein